MNWTGMWNSFKNKAIQLFGGLIMEEGWDGKYVISSGKVGYWIVLGLAVNIWLNGHEIQDGHMSYDIGPNHLTVLLALMAYNLGKKGLDHVESIWGSKLSAPDTSNAGVPGSDGPG